MRVCRASRSTWPLTLAMASVACGDAAETEKGDTWTAVVDTGADTVSAWISATNREDSRTKVAAISAGAGITDWRTHYGWEYDNYTTGDFTFGAPPWQRGEAYDRASPMTYVQGARTPTLFQHVEDDPIVPLAGSRRQYRALLEQGVDTRMIVYPGRSHGIPMARQRLGAMRQNWAWFAKYLWGEDASPLGGAEGR